tara:strand:+ start:1511 stop:2134 length:624 start_codon:yes stop_codon:yes gene_type:complete
MSHVEIVNGEEITFYSDKELEFRNKGLQEIKSVLNEINIECILIFGILLGAVRDKNYIKWDWDVELAVFPEEIYPKFDQLEVLVKDKGFEMEKVRIESKYFKTNLKKYDNKYTLLGLHKNGDMRSSKWNQVPSKYFDQLGEIEFLGEIYKTPSNVHGYLAFTYGENWRTPKITYNKKEYLSSDARIKISLVKQIINKLKGIFSRLFF